MRPELHIGIICAAIAVASLGHASAEAPGTDLPPASRRVLVAVGAHLLEPHELVTAPDSSPAVIARPIVALRASFPSKGLGHSGRWRIEPQLALALPRATQDGPVSVSSLLQGNVGYHFTHRLLALAGVGSELQVLASRGKNVSLEGSFVTPAGTATTWVFTLNAGLGFWLDSRFRLDAGMMMPAPFEQSRRRTRYLFEVGYAL